MTGLRAVLGVSLAGFLLVLGLPFASPAAADYTVLCSGYAGCKDAGYSNAGYSSEGSQMWWRMYSGHNCTNYAAYRMVKGGMSSERPWTGSGNGYNWGHAMASITDDEPMVGAVAWFDKYDGYAGGNGHVAYVEKVVNKRTIIISEDMWGGDFHWREITKTGRGWPTGFIHFNDVAVEATEQPTITGDVAVGEPLTATAGSWTPSADLSLQWLAAGKPIAGATDATYVPTAAQRKMRLSVAVTATKSGYQDGAVTSARTAKVQPGTLTVGAAPAITGTPQVDQVLTTTTGSFSPTPDSTSIQWYADGVAIDGATDPRLEVGPDLVGARISSTVTATLDGYRDGVVTSAATTQVQPGTIEVTKPFRLEGGTHLGDQLQVSAGALTPSDAEVAYTWLRDGKPVTDPATSKDGTHYDLGASDVGHVVSVRITASRAGYTDHVESLSSDHVVTTDSTTAVDAVAKVKEKTTGKGKHQTTTVIRKVVVRVQVSAEGVAGPQGPLTVKVGDQQVETRVVDGIAKVVVKDVPAGTQRVVATYAGNDVVLGSRRRTSVDVPRRG